MTTCNTSPNTPHIPMRDRLRLARLALKAKQDDISALWELSNRQVISDWERGRAVVPDEMLPKIEQLETWAAAGGNLDAVRTEIARVKDRELAAQIERAHSKATSWQAMGSRPVPLIEQPAQLTLQSVDLAPRSASVAVEPVRSPEPAAAAAPSPDTYTTISWESFVVEVDGVRGVSLRALVAAGLFEQMPQAVRALKASGADFTAVRLESRGGRPQEDHLMGLREAQRFSMRVRTPVGERIADLILDHHDELQRLIAGDADAQQRLADAQATHERIEAQAAADPLLGSLIALAQVRQTQLDQTARIEALERESRARAEHDRRMIASLEALPKPTEEARPLSPRKALVALVQDVGFKAGGGLAYHDRWAHLYAQFEHRYSIDLKTRAKNAGLKNPLDYAEQHDHLDALYALAVSIWRPELSDARA